MMDAVASAVAFGQAAKACVKLGNEIFQRYRAYKNSDDRLTELILRSERAWLKTSAQLELLDKIRHEFDTRLLESFDACLARLEIKLSLARIELEALTTQDSSKFSLDKLSLSLSRFKKARYSILERHIRKTVEELSEWQKEFDPSWLFTIRLTSDKVDSALTTQLKSNPDAVVLDDVKAIRTVLKEIESGIANNSSVFKDRSLTVATASQNTLPYSDLVIAKLNGSNKDIVLDTTSYPSNVNSDQVKKHVSDLARILMQGDPATLGLLRCVGVLETTMDDLAVRQYQLIYSIPDSLLRPATLRHMLSESSVSLDVKFSLARSLARGVASVHAASFVHKNIRPETILVFQKSEVKQLTAFLVGFERFRGVSDGTSYVGDMVWHRNLYRHPQRQGRKPDFMYEMRHDIYSLGVCLLEIGLWESFVLQVEPPLASPSLSISAELDMNNKRQAALDIKKKLLHIASDKLPSLMGLAYSEIVISCLTCLDPNVTNVFAADKDLVDGDGIQVGMVFIEKVFTRLLSIGFSDS